MKKFIAVTILLSVIPFALFSQRTKDALYLKNGSIIYGRLVEVDSDKYKIRTSDGSFFVYGADEVEKYVESEKDTRYFEGRKVGGFTFSLEGGLLLGAQNSNPPAPFSFNFLGGITIDKLHVISAGSGVEFIQSPFTPFFAEYKYIVRDKKTSPFLFIRAGGLFSMGGDEENATTDIYSNGPKDYKGGPSFTMGSGISWAKEDYETYLSFAYRHAETSFSRREYNRGIVTYENMLNRLEIKFGFKF
jgi:hypothetical protein